MRISPAKSVAALYLVLWCEAGLAFQPPRSEWPNFDRRLDSPDRVVTHLDVAQLNAASKLRRQVPGVAVEFDRLSGSPRVVCRPDGFLTGQAGLGGGVVAADVNRFGPDEKHRVTKAFLSAHRDLFGFGPEDLAVARLHRDLVGPDNGLVTTVWQQQLEGLNIFGAWLISNVTEGGELVTLSSGWLLALKAQAGGLGGGQSVVPLVTAAQAISRAAEAIDERVDPGGVRFLEEPQGPEARQRAEAAGLLGDVQVCLIWLPLGPHRLQLCWEVILTSQARGEMYRLVVDAFTGEALVRHGLTAYVAPASYRVYTSDSPSPFSPGHPAPSGVQPALVARELVVTGALDTNASPAGWMADFSNETLGNNVDAHLDRNNDNIADFPRPQGNPWRIFDFPLDLNLEPVAYSNAAVVNLFFWSNWTHDQLYLLGFTEAAGNFQHNNFGRGGIGNDAIQAEAQDTGGLNNANFSSPPDGMAGRLQMYLWNGPTPDRDGSLDAEIIIHEYVHGLSGRLVGGGSGLSEPQSLGMGEGWSDFYALALLSSATDDLYAAYAMGAYTSHRLTSQTNNYYFGIRRYPYTTDLLKNPLTFKDIDPTQASSHSGIPRNPVIPPKADQVHNVGTVWATMLWEARAQMIAKHGFDRGNRLILQLVTDAMKLSPPNPNFVQARDAIFLADRVNNSGANQDELWVAFAKRGLGFSATSPPSSTMVGVIEAFDHADELSIIPLVSFNPRGIPGGPFTPSSHHYLLTNTSSNNLAWSLTASVPWLNFSTSEGELSPRASVTVTAVVSSVASGLPAGIYTGQLSFRNQTKGEVRSVDLSLRIGYDHFTETFQALNRDLDFTTLTFVPRPAPVFYEVCQEVASTFPTDPSGGTPLSLGDDTFAEIILARAQNVSLFATRSPRVLVGSNGYLTLNHGDTTAEPSLFAHFQQRRISGLFHDLDPSAGGLVRWQQLADRLVVSFINVPAAGSDARNSFQMELFFSGVIRLTYLGIAAPDGLVGLSDGQGLPTGFEESDFRASSLCGAGSLQNAIATAAPDSVIYLPRGVYAGRMVIDRDLTLQGSGLATTILDGGGEGPVLTVATNTVVTLAGLTVRNGEVDSGPGAIENAGHLSLLGCSLRQNHSAHGPGAIRSWGDLWLDHCHVLGNRSADGPGAWDNRGRATGSESLFATNQGTIAGALVNLGSASFTNVTFSGNVATGDGGAVHNLGTSHFVGTTLSSNAAAAGGALYNAGNATVILSTLSGNRAVITDGGGIFNHAGGSLSLQSTTVAFNQASRDGGGLLNSASARLSNTIVGRNGAGSGNALDIGGQWISDGYNLVQAANGHSMIGNGVGNLLGFDPSLAPLSDNGGWTLTHALANGSPAIDRGSDSSSPLDQRGLPRLIDRPDLVNALGGADIGALELNPDDFVFVQAVNGGTSRSNVTGWIGLTLRVGPTPITVTALGRVYLTGNTRPHTVKLVRAADGTEVPNASVVIPAVGVVSGRIQYAPLPTPITLEAGLSYYLVSEEKEGADAWLDSDSVWQIRSLALIENEVLNTNGNWVSGGDLNTGLGPVSFRFSPCAVSPPNVALLEPRDDALYGAGSDVPLKAMAWDCDGSVVAVEFFYNAQLLARDTTPPYQLVWSSVPAGEYALTARALDDAGLTTTSAPVRISVVVFAERNFVTATSLGSLRNDFTGWAGLKFTTGAQPVPVLALGRFVHSGNRGTHEVKLVRANDGVDVPGGAVLVALNGSAEGEFEYASLPRPVTLSADTGYYLVSREQMGSDRWCDLNTFLTPSRIATCDGPVYGTGAGWFPSVRANSAYVPLDFIYGDAPAVAPSVTSRPLLLSHGLGRSRNDFSGWVGMKFRVGSRPLNVTHLGRISLNGNTASHTLKLVDATTGLDLADGSTTVALASGVVGQFQYGPLLRPIILAPQRDYYLVSAETIGGDHWSDLDTTVTAADVAQCLGAVWNSGEGWNFTALANRSYVPVDLKYSAGPLLSLTLRQGIVTLSLEGVVGVTYLIETSADLEHWSELATERLENTNRVVRTLSPSSGLGTYFRAREVW